MYKVGCHVRMRKRANVYQQLTTCNNLGVMINGYLLADDVVVLWDSQGSDRDI